MKLSPVDYNPFVAGEDVIRNVKYVESRGNPNAVSPKGAVGTMQTMPSTLKDPGFGVSPAKNTSSDELERVGKDYFDAMYEKYGDMDKALAAYNFGPGNLDNAITKYGENWKKGLPTETKEYIEKVKINTR
jgi:soluble lytic murein transglycosylase-like protein